MTEQPQPFDGGLNPNFKLSSLIEQDTAGVVKDEWPKAVAAARHLYEQVAKTEDENHLLKDQNFELHYEATHDQLTGLLNLNGLDEALGKHFTHMRDKGHTRFILLFVDGTNVKAINDGYNHTKGDKAIQGTASVLSKSLRKEDILARIGGDEFVIIPREREGEDIGLNVAAMEERINIETGVFLDANPDYKKVGFNIAVGSTEVALDDSFDFARAREEAEKKMSIHKAGQHAERGKYR